MERLWGTMTHNQSRHEGEVKWGLTFLIIAFKLIATTEDPG